VLVSFYYETNTKNKIKIKRLKHMTYSSALAINRQRYIKKNQNSFTFKQDRRRIGPVTNTVMLVVMSCLVGLLYLSQVSKTNAYGYKIDELRRQSATLKTEHNELEVEAARLQSLDRAKNSAVANSLVAVAPTATAQN
jgi:hypothetical protein